MLFFLEHSIQDASITRSGGRRVISKRVLYVELDAAGKARHMTYAPYLDYRPLGEDEPDQEAVLARPECAWISSDLEQTVQQYAVGQVVPEHLGEIRQAKQPLIAKIRAAVQDRLTKETAYWDRRAGDLAAQEPAGRVNARLNSTQARRRADLLQERREKRLAELDLEDRISAAAANCVGGYAGCTPQPHSVHGRGCPQGCSDDHPRHPSSGGESPGDCHGRGA